MALTSVNCLCQVFGACFDSPEIVFGLLIRSMWEAGLQQFVFEGKTRWGRPDPWYEGGRLFL